MNSVRKHFLFLSTLTFINGLCVMIMEMVGARLLAPWLGSSIIVWSSLIGVILASMSIGYGLGGKLADTTLNHPGDIATHNAYQQLSRMFLLASGAVILTGYIQYPLLQYLTTIRSLHITAIFAAILMFAPISLLCGMISPFITRCAIHDPSQAGTVIGKLNAISTIGSIAGTFLGGFVLIAWFGSVQILWGIAFCLLICALLIKRKPYWPKLVLLTLLALCTLSYYHETEQLKKQGIVRIESPYTTLSIEDTIMEGRPVRVVKTDPRTYQSGEYLDEPNALQVPYTRYYELATRHNPQAHNILMLGGGGFSVPKWLLAGHSGLKHCNISIDVIEMDPKMTVVARQYFNAPIEDKRLKIYHEDARRFINRAALEVQQNQRQPYDLIFGDVFNTNTVPFHLGSVEAAQRIHTLLSQDGIFLMNMISGVEGDNSRVMQSIYHAFAEVFPEVYLYRPFPDLDTTIPQNIMLLATRQPLIFNNDQDIIKLAPMLASRITLPIPDNIPALRDNYAPVERYKLGF